MQLTIVIILCIFLILCMWFIQYKPQPNLDPANTKEGFKIKNLGKKILNGIKKQIDNIKATKGGALLSLIPPLVTAKIAKISPQIKKEEEKAKKKLQEMKNKYKKETKKQREERERKEREAIKLKLKQEEKKRLEAATKTINKLMALAPKYPDSKYDMQTIINGDDMSNFRNGTKLVNTLRTYVNGPFMDPEQVVLLVKMLREGMALPKFKY